jgi:hypothetical protein
VEPIDMKCLAAALLPLALLAPGPVARAQDHCDAIRGDEGVLPGKYLPQNPAAWPTQPLPDRGDADAALIRLDDGGDGLAAVHELDLDGDGHPERFLTSADGRLCGSAGCPYVLLASDSQRVIGDFFGHLAVLDERINGYRIIQSFSRLLAGATNLDTYVFDGERYRLVAHAILDPCGLDQWGRRMHEGP